MQTLTYQDNARCYQLEQDILAIGDAKVSIEEAELKSPAARTARRNALAMLHNARTFLDQMEAAELKNAQARAKRAGL